MKTHPHVDKKLRFRIIVYFVISFIMFCVVFFDIFKQYIHPLLAAICVIVGVGIGIITTRMFHISWDQDTKKVMARLDLFGGIILVGYICVSFMRGRIIGQYVHGPAVGAVSFSFLAGTMLGRVLGTRGKVMKILKEQNLL